MTRGARLQSECNGITICTRKEWVDLWGLAWYVRSSDGVLQPGARLATNIVLKVRLRESSLEKR